MTSASMLYLPEDIQIAASLWVFQIKRSTRPDDVRPQLDAWLASNPLHERALNLMTSVDRIREAVSRGATPDELIAALAVKDPFSRPFHRSRT